MHYIPLAILTILIGTQPAWAVPAAAAWFAGLSLGAQILVVGLAVFGYQALSKSMAKGGRGQKRSLMVNKQSNNDPIPVVYGRKRIGGVRAFIDTSDGGGNTDKTSHLNLALVVAEGELGEIKKVLFNDKVVWDGDDDGTTSGNRTSGFTLNNIKDAVVDGEDTKDYSAVTDMVWHPGSDTQAVDTTLQTSIGSSVWTNDHTLSGLAYLALVLDFGDGSVWQGGLPTITIEADGKKIQDVSSITTGDTTRTLANGTADQNPVDVLYDYLVDRRYGVGLDYDTTAETYRAGYDIDIDSFKRARTYVTTTATTQYKINGHLETSANLFENVNEILESFNAYLIYTAGKYRLRVRQSNDGTSTDPDNKLVDFTFDETNIIGDLKISMQDVTKRLNTAQSTFANRDLAADNSDGYEKYNDDTVVVPTSTDTTRQAYLGKDKNRVLELRTENNLITEKSIIQRLLEHKLDDSRYGMLVEFDVAHVGIQAEAGDIIQITHPHPGWENKQFRVLVMALTNENTIRISAIEYQGGIEI